MIKHLHPTPSTQKNVLAASGNECAFPGCSKLIFDLSYETLIGTIAHIRARCENGPRFDPKQSEDENRAFGNLIAMCAEHSKIIDGTKWAQFSVDTLTTWKREHEQRVVNKSDRNWIKPANSITRFSPEGARLHFSYWVDRDGRPQLFNSHQLAIINALMAINLMILKLSDLPKKLETFRDANVTTVLQQEWAKFETEMSVIADLCVLLAMAGNITFAEFLGFLVQDNDPTSLVQEGARRVDKIAKGESDALAKKWYRSDLTS